MRFNLTPHDPMHDEVPRSQPPSAHDTDSHDIDEQTMVATRVIRKGDLVTVPRHEGTWRVTSIHRRGEEPYPHSASLLVDVAYYLQHETTGVTLYTNTVQHAACYLGVLGCTASFEDHPRGDVTMSGHCRVCSEKPGSDGGRTGPVLHHYNGRTYECWYCATVAFHAKHC